MTDTQIDHILNLLKASDYEQAIKVCQLSLKNLPEDANMLGLLGLSQLKSGKLAEAETTLLKTIRLYPKFSQPHEDLAVLYMSQNQPLKAEPLFRHMTDLKPDNNSAWFGLAHALKALGRITEANEAHVRYSKPSPQNQLASEASRQQQLGNFSKARSLYNEILQREPDNINVLRNLAVIASKQGDAKTAEEYLLKIRELAKDTSSPYNELARFYNYQARYVDEMENWRKSVATDPTDASTQIALAESLARLGLPDQALSAFEAAQQLSPDSAICMIGRADSLRATGQSERAIEILQQCTGDKVVASMAWWRLSSSYTHSFSDNELQAMSALRAKPTTAEADQVYLDFALAKAWEDRGEYETAWQHYASGNASKRRKLYFDGTAVETEFNAIVDLSSSLPSNLPPQERSSATPLFIVGMPRSGSTLVEQILGSHSQVEGTGELGYMLSLAKPLFLNDRAGKEPAITELGAKDISEIGTQYLLATKMHRLEGKPYFVDKMPDNFQMVPIIALLFPEAKIIDIRRNPLDNCVANFRKLYAQGKNFSYDLLEMAEYYLQYRHMMDRWDALFPGRVLRINYEELTSNAEGEISRLLSFCHLEWEEPCLNFHQTERSITTPSSEQVRQPIYQSAVGFWKNYQAQVGELIDIFEPMKTEDK